MLHNDWAEAARLYEEAFRRQPAANHLRMLVTCYLRLGQRANAVSDFCDGRCVSPLYCTFNGGNEPGTCQEHPGPGGDCSSGDAQCPSDHYCKDVELICVERPSVDQTCSDIIPCREEHFCNEDFLCKPRPGEDEPCTVSECQFGLFCSTRITQAATGVCWAPLPNNAVCTSGSQCQSLNCYDDGTGTETKRCQAYENCYE